jgi:hypothetical protein
LPHLTVIYLSYFLIFQKPYAAIPKTVRADISALPTGTESGGGPGGPQQRLKRLSIISDVRQVISMRRSCVFVINIPVLNEI